MYVCVCVHGVYVVCVCMVYMWCVCVCVHGICICPFPTLNLLPRLMYFQ